jgi:hypothetical protein
MLCLTIALAANAEGKYHAIQAEQKRYFLQSEYL